MLVSRENRPLMAIKLFPLDPEATERGTLLQARHHSLICRRPFRVGCLVGHVRHQLGDWAAAVGDQPDSEIPRADRPTEYDNITWKEY